MKLYKKYIIAVLLNFLAGLSSYGFRIILADSLSAEDYGYFYFLFNLFSIILIVCSLGFKQTLPKLIPQYQAKQPENIKKLIYSSCFTHFSVLLIVTSVLFILQDYFFKFSNITSTEYQYIFILYLSVFFISSLLGYFTNIFLGFQRILIAQFWLFFRYAIPILMYIALVSVGHDNSFTLVDAMSWFVLAHLICFFLATIFFLSLIFFKLKEHSWRPLNYFWHLKSIYNVSKYTFHISLFIVLTMHIDSIILMVVSDLTEVGIFNYAIPFVMIIWLISNQLYNVFLPALSDFYNRYSEDQTFFYVKNVLLKTCIYVSPIIIAAFIFKNEILVLFFGPKALIATASFSFLTMGAIFFTIGYYLVHVMVGINLEKYALIIVTLGLIVNFILNILLDGYLGATGAAIANSAAMLTVSLSGIYYFVRLKKWAFLDKNISITLLLLALSLAIGHLISMYNNLLIVKLISYVVLTAFYVLFLRHFHIYDFFSELGKLTIYYKENALKRAEQ